jgi:hypothetical protein
MVKDARKYLIKRIDSSRSGGFITRPVDGLEPNPLSKMKSNRNGLSGWTLMPFNSGGLNAGLRDTILPGAGKGKSWAWAKGKGPKVLSKKAQISP